MAIVCPTCRSVYVDGTLFCDNCGNWLIGVAPQPDAGTSAAPPSAGESPTAPRRSATPPALPDSGEITDEVPWLQPVGGWPASDDSAKEASGTLPLPRRSDLGSNKLPAPGGVPTRLRVLILNTGRLTDWIDDALIQIGRTDRSVNVFPQIDLEVDGGHNAGVSRRHVRIHKQPDGFFVEDLGSINGTFLNRRRLSPSSNAELRDGDELRVGNIVLRVQLGGYAPHS